MASNSENLGQIASMEQKHVISFFDFPQELRDMIYGNLVEYEGQTKYGLKLKVSNVLSSHYLLLSRPFGSEYLKEVSKWQEDPVLQLSHTLESHSLVQQKLDREELEWNDLVKKSKILRSRSTPGEQINAHFTKWQATLPALVPLPKAAANITTFKITLRCPDKTFKIDAQYSWMKAALKQLANLQALHSTLIVPYLGDSHSVRGPHVERFRLQYTKYAHIEHREDLRITMRVLEVEEGREVWDEDAKRQEVYVWDEKREYFLRFWHGQQYDSLLDSEDVFDCC